MIRSVVIVVLHTYDITTPCQVGHGVDCQTGQKVGREVELDTVLDTGLDRFGMSRRIGPRTEI